MTALAAVHFIRKQRHGKVGQMQAFTPLRHIVKTVAVITDKMNGNDIPLHLGRMVGKKRLTHLRLIALLLCELPSLLGNHSFIIMLL
ncbi:MAG: hypothetical protein II261_01745, partial [Bacteroidaceae bacterium]|nr:hypothetical protein [Bacteroidaceae bacterium]